MPLGLLRDSGFASLAAVVQLRGVHVWVTPDTAHGERTTTVLKQSVVSYLHNYAFCYNGMTRTKKKLADWLGKMCIK